MTSVLSSFTSAIPDSGLDLLHEIGRAGDEVNQSVYIVGGFVRDLLLRRNNLDIDIVVEGEATQFAAHLAEKWHGRLITHHQFGTATVEHSDGRKIDFVTARHETYTFPGALPLVRPGTIADDLRRRDFSINAVAIKLNRGDFGTLVDATEGLKDLHARRIRVLHDRSFVDDPTRIFRAIRYEQRYRFQISEDTHALICQAIEAGALRRVSGQRIRNEIDRIFAEDATPTMVRRMGEFNLFSAVHPDWESAPDFDLNWDVARQANDWALKHLGEDEIDGIMVRWLALVGVELPPHVIEAVSDRLELAGQLRKLCDIGCEFQSDLDPHKIAEALRQAFEHQNLSLSQDVFIRAESNQWSITDRVNQKAYSIRKEKEKLTIYHRQTPLAALQSVRHAMDKMSPDSTPSEIYTILKAYPLEALVFESVHPFQANWQAETVKHYLTHLRHIQPLVNGDDLIQWGFKPGKEFGDLLWKVFSAQLDGVMLTKQDVYQFLGQIDNGY